MNTKRIEKKLNLKKITITHLNNQEMRMVQGQGTGSNPLYGIGCLPTSMIIACKAPEV